MNDFLKTIVTILSIGLILALFTWKPIDIAWKVYDKYEDFELAFYGLMIAFVAYLLVTSIFFGIAYCIASLVEYIHKRANEKDR